MSLPARLESKIHRTDSCWEWTAHTNAKGYGTCHIGSLPVSSILAHRAAYELLVGSIPEGLTLDHLCRNKACVNPDHLEPVTNQVNQLRGNGEGGRNARKTQCPLGHPYDEKNTRTTSAGQRACRKCTNGSGAGRIKTLEIISMGVS